MLHYEMSMIIHGFIIIFVTTLHETLTGTVYGLKYYDNII